jgi:hypothetical protein
MLQNGDILLYDDEFASRKQSNIFMK